MKFIYISLWEIFNNLGFVLKNSFQALKISIYIEKESRKFVENFFFFCRIKKKYIKSELFHKLFRSFRSF